MTPQAPVAELLVAKGTLVLAALVALFAAERLWSMAPAAGDWRRWGRNAALWAVNVGLAPLVVVPLTLWADGAALGRRPAWWHGGAGLALDIVILDLAIYWWHRANHEVPLLWRFHEVHHLDGVLDTTTALRFHFGEVLLSAGARAAAILALGVPLASVLTFEALVMTAALFHHSNLRLPPRLERRLAALIVTPSIHWVHHHKTRDDTDRNYGTVLAVWDRLFASRSRTPRYRNMPLGVEGRSDQPLLRLLVAPFLPRA